MSNDYFFKTPRFCLKCENLLQIKSIFQGEIIFECRSCSKTTSFVMPKAPLLKKCLKDCINFDPVSLKLYKNDPTLQVEDLKCPVCDYPMSKSVSSEKVMGGKLAVYHFCERKKPLCGFSWMD